jgi:hypothetical protein
MAATGAPPPRDTLTVTPPSVVDSGKAVRAGTGAFSLTLAFPRRSHIANSLNFGLAQRAIERLNLIDHAVQRSGKAHLNSNFAGRAKTPGIHRIADGLLLAERSLSHSVHV